MAAKHVGYVLPEDAVSTTEVQVFPEFPGYFKPGEPVGLMHTGLTEEEADALVKEHDLPLEKVELSAQKAKKAFVADPMHATSAFEEGEVGRAEDALAEKAEEHEAEVEAAAEAAEGAEG